MPIFKYTLIKYLKSISTWVITIISIAIVFSISGPLFYSALPIDPTIAQYNAFSTSFYSGMILLIILLGSIFAGFKGSQLYRDEIEDGTFLIVLSKPQSRSCIILFKWLALFLLNIIFLALIIAAFSIAVLIFEKKYQGLQQAQQLWNISIKHNLLVAGGIIFAIGMVIMLILSSIALIISTKVSTGGTIGITIAIGVAVQITGVIGQFSTTTTYDSSYLSTRSAANVYIEQIYSDISNDIKIKPSGSPIVSKEEFAIVMNGAYYASMTSKEFSIEINHQPLSFQPGNLGFTSINIHKIPTFNYLSYLDLSYQSGLLGNIANTVITNSNTQQNSIAIANADNKGSAPGQIKKKVLVKSFNSSSEAQTEISNKVDNNIKKINDFIDSITIDSSHAAHQEVNWNFFVDYKNLIDTIKRANIPLDISNVSKANSDSKRIEQILFGNLNPNHSLASLKKLDLIKYVDFINKYGVLAVYGILALALIPISYLILRRQDFR